MREDKLQSRHLDVVRSAKGPGEIDGRPDQEEDRRVDQQPAGPGFTVPAEVQQDAEATCREQAGDSQKWKVVLLVRGRHHKESRHEPREYAKEQHVAPQELLDSAVARQRGARAQKAQEQIGPLVVTTFSRCRPECHCQCAFRMKLS